MKSFRAERQQKHASTQVIVTLLILLGSIVLIQMLPAGTSQGQTAKAATQWESSIVNLK